jgi:dTMP kinase
LQGRFITFEGCEGVGKSTQILRLAAWLRGVGQDVVLTREPGGTPRAEQVRRLLLDRSEEPMPDSCELLLMFAARATHLANLVYPAIERGAWVLCDRFTDATFAYQGGGRGVPDDRITALARMVHPGFEPDLTILLDAPVEVGLRRAAARNGGDGPDRFEAEEREFFARVRAAYRARAGRYPGRIRLVDASQPVEAVGRVVRDVVQALRNAG